MSFISRPDDEAGVKIERQASSIFDSMHEVDLKRVSMMRNKIRLTNRKKEKEERNENTNQSTRKSGLIPEHTITQRGVENNEEEIANVFDQWTASQMREALRSEPLASRVYRRIALIAGLVHPLNERDYQHGLHKEFNGDYEEFDAKFFSDKMDKAMTGYQLHGDQLPFDINHLFKDSRIIFLIGCIFLYFLILSALFVTWGWGLDCFDQDSMTYENALPLGFLLLSGIEDAFLSEEMITTGCLYMKSFAVLIGTYISLPVFGAMVLVRLLDNKADVIKLSSTVLLTVRGGIPTIQIRALAAHGRFIPNFSVDLQAIVLAYDSDMDDAYVTDIKLESEQGTSLGYFPILIKHKCTENSPLIRNGVVEIDEETLVPRWNRSKIMFLTVVCNAEGARPAFKEYRPNKMLMIGPDEKGCLPSFANSTPVQVHHWKKYAGKVSMINDMSKLSVYKYSDVEYRKKDIKRKKISLQRR